MARRKLQIAQLRSATNEELVRQAVKAKYPGLANFDDLRSVAKILLDEDLPRLRTCIRRLADALRVDLMKKNPTEAEIALARFRLYGPRSEQTNPLPPQKTVARKKERRTERFAQSDAFLTSYEWRKVRLDALTLHGRACQCCGAKPPHVVLNVDHVLPRKTHPHLALILSNLQVLCGECNHGKGNRTHDFRETTATA